MSWTEHLLGNAPVTAAEYAAIEDRCREVLGTGQTMFVFQGEALVALEAAARGLGRPASRALNLVSGPYGATFGLWLSQAGAEVENVVVPFDQAVAPELVETALDRAGAVDLVSVVHAEASTGVVNDLAAIARAARSRGALVVVDAVASVGAEPMAIDDWGLDMVVLSAQKALAGPAGVSPVVVSSRAWEALASHPSPWRASVLSLLDWRDRWTGTDRSELPVIPSHVETRAFGAAVERVAEEGLARVIARHRSASVAMRAAMPPLGLKPWVTDQAQAASVATLVRAPAPGAQVLVAACLSSSDGLAPPIGMAPSPLAQDAVRVNHTGRQASLAGVCSAVTALGLGLNSLACDADLGAALEAAVDAWFASLDGTKA